MPADHASLTPEEARIRELVAELSNMLVASGGKRTDAMRELILGNRHVGDFESLAKTLILLCEGDPAEGPADHG